MTEAETIRRREAGPLASDRIIGLPTGETWP
jgi:hypothetical protein